MGWEKAGLTAGLFSCYGVGRLQRGVDRIAKRFGRRKGKVGCTKSTGEETKWSAVSTFRMEIF